VGLMMVPVFHVAGVFQVAVGQPGGFGRAGGAGGEVKGCIVTDGGGWSSRRCGDFRVPF